MRTGEVAQQAGVNLQTLRYYERRGLLKEPKRRPSGYRSYPQDTVDRLRFVKRAQQLGFTLTEVEGLLNLASGGPTSCEQARTMATEKVAELDAKITALRAMRKALDRLIDTCDLPRGSRTCPLIDSLQRPIEAAR